jgi:hypothetical protein
MALADRLVETLPIACDELREFLPNRGISCLNSILEVRQT